MDSVPKQTKDDEGNGGIPKVASLRSVGEGELGGGRKVWGDEGCAP